MIQVYLAMEQREHNAETKATRFTNEFAKKFRSIDFTIHPSDIPGELAGKGSNMAWAARKLSERYSLGQRKDVIVTGIDGGYPIVGPRLGPCVCTSVLSLTNRVRLQLTAISHPITLPM